MQSEQKAVEFEIPINATLVSASLDGAPLIKRMLDIKYMNQTASNWCWAACAAMLSRFTFKTNTKICEVVATLYSGGDDCCAGAPAEGDRTLKYNNEAYNKTCSFEDVTTVHEKLKMQSIREEAAITFDELLKQIAELGNPVEAAFLWTGGGGHVVLVCGVDNQKKTVFINDPWPDKGQSTVLFDKLQSAYGKGKWIDTWINISAKN